MRSHHVPDFRGQEESHVDRGSRRLGKGIDSKGAERTRIAVLVGDGAGTIEFGRLVELLGYVCAWQRRRKRVGVWVGIGLAFGLRDSRDLVEGIAELCEDVFDKGIVEGVMCGRGLIGVMPRSIGLTE